MKGACVDCIWYEAIGSGGHFCGNVRYIDPVTGEAVTPCRDIRNVPTGLAYLSGGCGRSGRFFSPKEANNGND